MGRAGCWPEPAEERVMKQTLLWWAAALVLLAGCKRATSTAIERDSSLVPAVLEVPVDEPVSEDWAAADEAPPPPAVEADAVDEDVAADESGEEQ